MSDQRTPCFIRKVEALIANEHTRFTEDDKELLMGLEETVLDKILPVESPADPPAAPQVNAEDARGILKGTLTKPEEVLELLAPELQDQVKAGFQLHQDRRASLIKTIQANAKKDTWKEGELEGMKTCLLEKIAGSFPDPQEPVDYSLNANSATTTADPDVMLPLGVVGKN